MRNWKEFSPETGKSSTPISLDPNDPKNYDNTVLGTEDKINLKTLIGSLINFFSVTKELVMFTIQKDLVNRSVEIRIRLTLQNTVKAQTILTK